MKNHRCFDYINNPHKKVTGITATSNGVYKEQWIGTCTVCGRCYTVTKLTKYELSPVPEKF